MAFSKVILALGFVIVSIYTISVVEAEEKPEWKCLGESPKVQENPEKITQECTDEIKNAGLTGVLCLEACKYRKAGILVNDDPTFDTKKHNEIIDSTMPEAARAGIKADLKKCYDAEKTKLSNDDDCKSHETYMKCVGMAYYTNCKGDDEEDK